MKNKKMKRTYILTAILGLAFTFTACGSAAEAKSTQPEAAQEAASAQDSTQVQATPPIQTMGTLPDGTQVPVTILPDGTIQISQPSTDTTAQNQPTDNNAPAAQEPQVQLADNNASAASAAQATSAASAAPAAQEPQVAPTGNSSQASFIGEEKALQIALEHAGVALENVAYSQVKLENDDGRWEYDTEFYSGSKEYDYEIDASTGEILGYDHDIESVYLPSADNAQSSAASVSLETAKSSALAKVPGAGESNIRINQDYDDGRLIYEGKIIYNTTEYEFEIDATTGTFLEWSAESIYD